MNDRDMLTECLAVLRANEQSSADRKRLAAKIEGYLAATEEEAFHAEQDRRTRSKHAIMASINESDVAAGRPRTYGRPD